jgi:hypothetical protein
VDVRVVSLSPLPLATIGQGVVGEDAAVPLEGQEVDDYRKSFS